MSNKEEFGCVCFNPFGCYCVSKPKRQKPNTRGYRKITSCGITYEGETKDMFFGRCREGYGKTIFEDGEYFQGDWREHKIKQTRKIKKIPLDNAEDIFLQNINDYDKIDKKTFPQQQTKKNKIYVNITKGEKLPQKSANEKDHLKIIYSDHGNSNLLLKHPICDLPNANGRKSYYISNITCGGAFVDENRDNLIEKIEEKIKGTNTIGFFSHVDKQYSVVYEPSIDKDGRIGTKRAFASKQGADVNDEYFNTHKDEFFHYYCILNEGERQNVYKIPHQLCYWRETLIDDKNTSDKNKYPNKFMEALDNLKQGKSFKFTTKAQVDIGDKFVEQNTEITISGKIEKVEVITHDVRVPRIKVVQSEYQSESQSINNISSTYNNKNNNINNSNISDIDDEIKEINNANNKNSVDELDDDENELDDDEIKALDEDMKSVKVPFVDWENINDSNITTVVNKHRTNIKNNTITNRGNGECLSNH